MHLSRTETVTPVEAYSRNLQETIDDKTRIVEPCRYHELRSRHNGAFVRFIQKRYGLDSKATGVGGEGWATKNKTKTSIEYGSNVPTTPQIERAV